MKQTSVEWLEEQMLTWGDKPRWMRDNIVEQAKVMEKEKMLDFGEFIIDELEPMAQNRQWVEERYNYFKSE